tara:strand:+ start:16424 stop:17551 length:1128 start_codon:yes stop_codon:yes gene_type:complete
MALGSGDPDWELGNKLNALLGNPVAFRCVDLISQLFSQVNFQIEGQDADNDPLIKRLNNPNLFQSKQDFLREYIFFKYAYGWVFQKPIKPVGVKEISAIYNLNPDKVTYHKEFATRLVFEKNQTAELLKNKFKYEEATQQTEFSLEEIIPFFDIANGLSDDFLLKAPSRLHPIQKNIKNIDIALTAENNAIRKAGRFIFSAGRKGDMVGRAMDPKDKTNIESNFSKYGNANINSDVIITNAFLDQHSMHIPMNQLGIPESVKHNAKMIMATFGVPREMFNLDDSGGKYDSVEQAPIQLIQNVVQNQIDDYCNSLTSYFGLAKPLTGTLQHLSVMQYIEDKKAEKFAKMSLAIRNLKDSGVDYIKLAEQLGITLDQ